MSHPADINQLALNLINIEGPDATALLQALVTADVDSLEAGCCQAAALCNPKGRAEAVFLLTRQENSVGLILPDALAEPVMRKLKLFCIGRQVELETPVPVYPAPADDPNAWILAHDRGRALRTAFDEATQPLPQSWLADDVAARIPWLLPATVDLFLPQMLGLEQLGGLSYRKGCFPGQEVIARVHYRGRVTRRLARFKLDSVDDLPKAGAPVECEDQQGSVLYCAQDSAVTGLAVVPAEVSETCHLTISGQSGRLLAN